MSNTVWGVYYIFALKVLVVVADLEVSPKQGRKLTYIKVAGTCQRRSRLLCDGY